MPDDLLFHFAQRRVREDDGILMLGWSGRAVKNRDSLGPACWLILVASHYQFTMGVDISLQPAYGRYRASILPLFSDPLN